jgi:phosphoribosyl 1,2-cyclic phosphate phosphodiesterase
MRFIITGSGGCVSIPRPLCQCRVCTEARRKGKPYTRRGCSLYLEDLALLVDTPEDINTALNNAEITVLDTILYSHWDPDHTLGMRVVEQLRLEWLDYYENKKPDNPIKIFASNGVMRDINNIRNTHGSFLDYYEHMGLIERKIVNGNISMEKNIDITFIPVPKEKSVDIFLFRQNKKKLIYAPCDCKPFPENENMYNADILVIGNTFVGDVLKNNKVIGKNHPLRNELHGMENVIEIKERYNIGRVIITHLEEDWGKSFDDYKGLENEYRNIFFAYDGMKIEI